MSMTVKPGARLFSAVCSTEVIAIRVPPGEIDLTIGGAPPVASVAERADGATVEPGHDGGAAMGKRYVDTGDTIELLCTKPGDGIPALAGTPLELKAAKALPASD